MRKRAVGTPRDDRVERRLGPARAHRALEVALDLPLRPATEPLVHELLQDVRREVGRGADGAELAVVLHLAEPLDELARGDELDLVVESIPQTAVAANGQVVILESHLPTPASERRSQTSRSRSRPPRTRSKPLTWRSACST